MFLGDIRRGGDQRATSTREPCPNTMPFGLTSATMPLALKIAHDLRRILIVNAVEDGRSDGRLLETGCFPRRDVEGLPVDHRPVARLVHLARVDPWPWILAGPALTCPPWGLASAGEEASAASPNASAPPPKRRPRVESTHPCPPFPIHPPSMQEKVKVWIMIESI